MDGVVALVLNICSPDSKGVLLASSKGAVARTITKTEMYLYSPEEDSSLYHSRE
jgi:hypothetical protein